MTGPELYAEGHFVIIPEWVLDAEVSDKAVRLYGVLRSYADHRTGVAFPSRRTLAGRLHVADPKAVDRALTELETIGAIEVQRATNAQGQARTSNRYLLRHTPRGKYATPQDAPNGQTASSHPGGASAIGGESAPPPMAETPPVAPGPQPQWRQDHSPYGAGAPLTRSSELDPENQTQKDLSPTAGQLRLIEGPPPGLSAAAAFDTFWAAYPRKVGKDAARRKWAEVTRRTNPAVILGALTRYPFDRSRPQFIPYPQTWLHQGRWQDDLDAVAAAARDRGSAVSRSTYGAPHEDLTHDPANPHKFAERF